MLAPMLAGLWRPRGWAGGRASGRPWRSFVSVAGFIATVAACGAGRLVGLAGVRLGSKSIMC